MVGSDEDCGCELDLFGHGGCCCECDQWFVVVIDDVIDRFEV